MNNVQQIIRMLMPAIKGSPFIVGLMALLIFVASRVVFYATPMYESTGRIKLEDVNMGISNTNLFKDFDVFSHPNKIMAEVEVLKSPELIKYALLKTGFEVEYYRVGKIRTTELYTESPFHVKYTITDDKWYGKPIYFTSLDGLGYSLSLKDDDQEGQYHGKFSSPLDIDGMRITIYRNDSLLRIKPHITLKDQYKFIIYSEDQMVKQVAQNLDVKELDKEIPVIRIIFKHPVPQKAASFTNTVMESYIEDGIRIKTGAAKKTLRFIDDQLKQIAEQLYNSEQELEAYRLAHKITNTRMEVETGLKKVAEMKIQLSNIEMNEASLDTLDYYVNGNDPNDFLNKAPNYEGYGGLLYTEMIKRIKNLQAERKDLLVKYTPDSEPIRSVDAKIADVIQYIRQNIANTRKSMHIQREKIAKDIAKAEEEFVSVPTKEKDIVILERNFQLNQSIYNFLTEKRTEASIAQAATMSFHRIIQRGVVAEDPVSPKKTFTILVFAFVGLLAGLAIVYIYDAVSARIKYRDQLEKASSCPVLGDIRHEKVQWDSMPDFYAICTKLLAKSASAQSIAITSSVDGEGKTFIAEHLAIAFAEMGIKTLLMGSDMRDHSGFRHFNKKKEAGLAEYIYGHVDGVVCTYTTPFKNLDFMPSGRSDHKPEALFVHPSFAEKASSLKTNYKVVIWDTPSFDTALDGLAVMQNADQVLYVFRANFSKTRLAIEPDVLKEEYGFEHIKLLLNDVPRFAKMKRDLGLRKLISTGYRTMVYILKSLFKK